MTFHRAMTFHRGRFLILGLTLALAACGGDVGTDDVATLDDELAATRGDDPLLAAAVQDPIMTDTQLSGRSNADSIRPPAQPYAAPIPGGDVLPTGDADQVASTTVPDAAKGGCPLCAVARDAITLGALAARQNDPRTRACAPSLRYAAGWATRLPADIPLYTGAQVVEAAGTDAAACRLRAVTFITRRPVAAVLDWYYTQATRAGYATAHQADDAEHVLAGSRGRDGAAYVAHVRDAPGGGSEVDLLVDGGR